MSTDHQAAPVRPDGRAGRLATRPERPTTAWFALVLGLGSLVGALTLASAPAAVAGVLGLSLAVVLAVAAATVLADESDLVRLAVPVRDRRQTVRTEAPGR